MKGVSYDLLKGYWSMMLICHIQISGLMRDSSAVFIPTGLFSYVHSSITDVTIKKKQ
jgi:hypothetical protein